MKSTKQALLVKTRSVSEKAERRDGKNRSLPKHSVELRSEQVLLRVRASVLLLARLKLRKQKQQIQRCVPILERAITTP